MMRKPDYAFWAFVTLAGMAGMTTVLNVTGIDDQELAETAEFAGINDPAVIHRHDLSVIARLDIHAFGVADLGLVAK